MPNRSSVEGHPHLATIDKLIVARRSPLTAIAREFDVGYRSLARRASKILQGDIPPAQEPDADVALTAVQTFERAFGYQAMPHQVDYLEEQRSLAALKGRQTGFTQSAAGVAIHTSRTFAGSDTIIISPSQRQSTEVTKRARNGFWQLGEGLIQDSTTLLRLRNGSRVVSLPGNSRGIRGYSPLVVIIDEAAWVSDETWAAARPLVAASGGRLVVQSTPGHRAGWFYELCSNPPPDWAFMTIRSDQVPTISAEFLAAERRSMSPELYSQEYEGEFGRAGGALFSADRIASLILPDEPQEAAQ